MKPTSKMQKRIVELSAILPTISEKQEKYAFNKCFKHFGFRTKKGVTCMECGHVFDSNEKVYQCPECFAKIQILDTLKRNVRDNKYMCIVTTCEEFQVLRMVDVIQVYRKGEKARYLCREVVQNWIAPDGRFESISRLRANCFGYNYTWSWYSEMTLRKTNNSHYIGAECIYPERRYIPTIIRNGFRGNFCGFCPLSLFVDILSDSKAETLFKAKQYDILAYFMTHSYYAKELWPIVKICLRNNYFPKNVNVWKDYIDLLKHFKMDIKNAKFVCPENLNKAHKTLVAKRTKQREIEDRQREIEREAERVLKHEENLRVFNEIKSKFFGVQFSDNLISVKVLESLEEYKNEGLLLDHCVFANEYYGKPESLILSARIDNKPIETIELSLDKFEIIQCSGYDNQNSKYHKRIMDLVNNNVNLIKARKYKKQAA